MVPRRGFGVALPSLQLVLLKKKCLSKPWMFSYVQNWSEVFIIT